MGVCGAAVDVDPLSPEFQLIKAKSQIESLEHQLSTDRPASARTARSRADATFAALAVLRTDAATRAIQARDEALSQNEHLKMELGRCARVVAARLPVQAHCCRCVPPPARRAAL